MVVAFGIPKENLPDVERFAKLNEVVVDGDNEPIYIWKDDAGAEMVSVSISGLTTATSARLLAVLGHIMV